MVERGIQKTNKTSKQNPKGSKHILKKHLSNRNVEFFSEAIARNFRIYNSYVNLWGIEAEDKVNMLRSLMVHLSTILVMESGI